MKFLLGLAIVVGGFLFTTLIINNWDGFMLMQLLDAPSLIWFLMVITGVTVATGEFKTLIAAINAIASKKYTLSAHVQHKAIRLLKLLRKTVIYAAVTGVAVGTMYMLLRLDNPGMIGPLLSVAFVSMVYGAIINLVLITPAIAILETRRNTEEKIVISERQVIDKLLELCYRQGVTPEEILNAEEISFREGSHTEVSN